MKKNELTTKNTKGTKNKAYPKYKPSGVEWLGDVPEHWEIKKFNYVIGFQEGPGIMAIDFLDDGVPLLRIRNIQGNNVDLDDCNFLDPFKVAEKWNHFRCKKNDLLISGSASTGLICEVIESGIGAIPYTGIIRLWPGSKSIYKDYIRWIISSDQFDTQISIYQAGSTIKHFGPEHLKKMEVTLPPLPEQQAIAAFLDRETGRIDSLIDKKQRLLELLAEQRTALISRAVTKGLDATVKLKPSGVEWLGDVPEHWEVKRLKHLVMLRSGEGITVDDIEESGEYPVYGGNGFRGYAINFTHDGHFVLIGRQGALCGNINYAKGKFWASEHAVVATPWKPLATIWLGELLRLMNLNQYSISAAQPGLAIDRIKELHLPVPSLSEQQAIADFLDRETVKIDALSTKVITVIERLKEYRTALISSAVTGKIDVREAV